MSPDLFSTSDNKQGEFNNSSSSNSNNNNSSGNSHLAVLSCMSFRSLSFLPGFRLGGGEGISNVMARTSIFIERICH